MPPALQTSLHPKDKKIMALKLGKSILAAASTGLMLGAVAACGGSAPPVEAPASPEAPAAEAPAAPEAPEAAAPAGDAAAMPAAAEGKACCKTMNECKGKGGCKTDTNACAGKNECKGKGGCKARANCPK
jgi:hypothetical protein